MQNLLTILNNSQESLYVLLLILVTAAALFGLCGLSFMFGKKRDKHKSEFLKYCFFIPLWLGLLTCFTRLGQQITSLILPYQSYYPTAAAVMAAAIGLIGFGLLAEFRNFIPHPKSDFYFRYFLSLLGLLNIEIFSILHLPSVFLFTAEFIIILFSRYARKTWSISLFIVLMLVPFLPYLVPSFRSLTGYFLTGSTYTVGWHSSFLLSCAVLPFLLQVVRIQIAQGTWRRHKGYVFRPALISTLIRTFLCFLLMISATLYIYRHPVATLQSDTGMTSPEGKVSLSYTTLDDYGITVHTIRTTSTVPVLRYDITVLLQDDTTILFSDTEYALEGDSVIHFTVDSPEETMLNISFSTTVTQPGTVSITALDNGFYRLPVEYEP